MLNNGGRWAGALYTDVNAVIPTKAILAVAAASLLCCSLWLP